MVIAESLQGMMVPIGSVYRDPANINRHDETDLSEIKASLLEFGQVTPLVVNRAGMILKGNGTHEAAEQLGATEIAVSRFDDESDVAQIRYAIADNLTGRKSKLDNDALAKAVRTVGPLPGMNEAEREQFLRKMDVTRGGFNAAEALAANPDACRVEYGDVYRCGAHYVMCGDSTLGEEVAYLWSFVQGKAALIWTDPPYGIDYSEKVAHIQEWDAVQIAEGKQSKGSHRGMNNTQLANDAVTELELEILVRKAVQQFANFCQPGCAMYMAAPAGKNLFTLGAAWGETPFTLKWQLVWTKEQATIGRADYQFQHENILYGWKEDAAHFWCGSRNKSSVQPFNKLRSSSEHGTMKPIELVKEHLLNSSQPGEIVADMFGGSGTTLRACESLGRRCVMMERLPHFASVIVALWEAMTGLQAEKVSV